jgi:hypothetical protein
VAVVDALTGLDEGATLRVLAYLVSRFERFLEKTPALAR